VFQKIYGLDALMAVKTPILLGDAEPLVMRAMFNVLYEKQLTVQKEKMKPNWKPQTPLPARSGIVTPVAWAKAFRGALYVLVETADPPRLVRPSPGKEFILTAAGNTKTRQYSREAERLRTERILVRMREHAIEVVEHLPPSEQRTP